MRNRSHRNSALNQSGSSERQPDRTTGGAEGCLSSAALEGLRSECSTVWFDRGTYERAESLYYFTTLQPQNGTTAPASSSTSSRKQESCRHGGQEACHHVVRAVWVNKPNFDQAESMFVGRFPNQPRSLQLQPNNQMPCDEGYQSQTPTPPTPASKPINGLPCLPPPPMGVWLQKPLYDRAEASFYQNLYGCNSPPRNPEASSDESSSKWRNNAVAPQKKPVVCDQRDSDDVSTNQGAALCYFLHADSERVWLDRGRYVDAETRFYEGAAVKTSINHSSRKQKYDSILQKDCTHI